jgi:hypothetical protein
MRVVYYLRSFIWANCRQMVQRVFAYWYRTVGGNTIPIVDD